MKKTTNRCYRCITEELNKWRILHFWTEKLGILSPFTLSIIQDEFGLRFVTMNNRDFVCELNLVNLSEPVHLFWREGICVYSGNDLKLAYRHRDIYRITDI